MSYYPVYLDLRGRRCVVLGGGATALEKVRGVLDAGAVVTVMAADPNEEIAALAQDGRAHQRQPITAQAISPGRSSRSMPAGTTRSTRPARRRPSGRRSRST